MNGTGPDRRSFRHASTKLQILPRSVSTEGSRFATLPLNLFCSIPRPRQVSDPPTSFSVSVTLPLNLNFWSVPCPPKGTVPPRFRRISIFVPFRFHGRIAFRQLHFPLPSRFRRSSNFVPFRFATFSLIQCYLLVCVYTGIYC